MTVAAGMTAGRARPDGDRIASIIFLHAALFGAIVLQRFCVYIGGGPLFLCQPIFLGGIGWMLITGRATLRPGVLALLAGFTTLALVTTMLALNDPDPRVGLSIGSLLVLLLLYAGLVVKPTGRFDGRRAFDILMIYVRVCSVLGIVQYAVQFIGLRLFSFMVLVPQLRPFLVEPLFNYQPIVGYGSTIMRSNGFFLVEPSTFSQILVLGLIVDVLVRRDWRFVPLYVVAHILTSAGTGLLALAVTLPIVGLIDHRRSGRLLAFALAIGVAGVLGAVLLPDQFGALLGRSSELNYKGSSGYARYVAPFDMLGAVWGETRTLIGYGPGAMERASFYVPGGGSAAAKLFIDYGIAGLLAFVTFLVAALWRRDIAIVAVYGLVNFQLGGGFLLFPPFIVIMAVLCIWSAPVATGRVMSDSRTIAPIRRTHLALARHLLKRGRAGKSEDKS